MIVSLLQLLFTVSFAIYVLQYHSIGGNISYTYIQSLTVQLIIDIYLFTYFCFTIINI